MKRLRPERPSGKPRNKERRRCLKCDRFMTQVERWKKHQKTWLCKPCAMWYGYLDGVLMGVAGKHLGEGWWETKGRWRMIPEGLLLVYGGTPES